MRFNSEQPDFWEKMNNVRCDMSADEIVASIDQLSCVVVEKYWKNWDKIVIPKKVTESSIKRSVEVIDKIFKPAGFSKVGVSVRGGMMTDVSYVKKLLEDKQIMISSGDLPIRNVTGLNSLKYWIEDMTVEEKWPPSLAQLVGYRLHNVLNVKDLKQKYRDLEENVNKVGLSNIDGKKIIRWDIYGLCDDGDKIIDLMDDNTVLAVEYYPRFGIPEQFFEKIDSLRLKYPKKQIGISFDPVYYMMAARIHKGQKILDYLRYFQKIIKEKPDQLVMMEVNQMAQKSNKPHTAVAEGNINFYRLLFEYGKSYRMGRLYYIPHFVYEPLPKLYEQVIQEGKEYMIGLKQSFAGDESYARDIEKSK